MDKFYNSALVRAADRIAVEKLGIPGIVLMENAGRGAAELIMRLYPAAPKITILCGSGNNGGDGFVAARHLLLAGLTPSVFTTVAAEVYKGDAAASAHCAEACGVRLIPSHSLSDEELSGVLSSADLVVDALLGTGSKGAPRGETARIIPMLKSARAVVSLDIPSGIDPDTGFAEGAFVRADVTATFLAGKKAFGTEQGALASGAVFVCHIGVPAQLVLR